MSKMLSLFQINFDTTWIFYAALIIGLVLIIWACLKYPKAGKFIILGILGVAFIGISAYCGIQLNYYYSATGGVYGQITGIFKTNEVNIVDELTYNFSNMELTKSADNTYSASIVLTDVIDLENKSYGVYVNDMPCSYVENTDDYVIAKYTYSFLDDDMSVLCTDTLTIRFAFYTNSTYLSVSTSSGDTAYKYWNYYFNKNTFIVKLGEAEYTSSSNLSVSEGDTTNFVTVTYVDGSSSYERVYSIGSVFDLPNIESEYFEGWSYNGEILTTGFKLTDSITLTAEYDFTSGLYDSNNNLLVSYKNSGMDVTVDYTNSESSTSLDYYNSTTSAYYVLTNVYPTAVRIILPNTITHIGNYAFCSCSSLTSISIPESITTIGEGAFCSCSGLTSISIPNGVTSIGVMAFEGLTAITSVTIPKSVRTIGGSAFSTCVKLSNVVFEEGIQLTSIADGTFYYCFSLPTIIIPEGVTSIGDSAFSRCSGLTSVVLPNSLTSIGVQSFQDCTSLTSIYIPSSVTNISGASSYGYSPFMNCSSSLVIYCGVSEAQSGWETYWNYYTSGKTLTVNYGYTYEQYLEAIA